MGLRWPPPAWLVLAVYIATCWCACTPWTSAALSVATPFNSVTLAKPYAPYTNCTWSFTAPAGYLLRVTGAASPDSPGDDINILDGNSLTSPSLGVIHYPFSVSDGFTLLSSGPALTINLLGDGFSAPDLGSALALNVSIYLGTLQYCSGVQNITIPFATQVFVKEPALQGLTSYRFSGGDGVCAWYIHSNPDTIIQWYMNYPESTMVGELQLGDSVVLYDGEGPTAPIMAVYTGGMTWDHNPAWLGYTTGNHMYVEFITLPGLKAPLPGFHLEVDARVLHLCSGLTNIPVTTNVTQQLVYTGGAYLYTVPGLHCQFLFTSPPGTSLQVTRIGGWVDYGDVISVYDGSTTTSQLMGQYIDCSLPLRSSSNALLVDYEASDVPGTHCNPKMFVSVIPTPIGCGATQTYTALNGTLSSSTPVLNQPYSFLANTYRSGQSCKFFLSAPTGYTIRVSFDYAPLLPEDKLLAYDVDSSNQPTTLLGQASWGSVVFSTSQRLMIEYQMSDSISSNYSTQTGFTASYIMIAPNPTCGTVRPLPRGVPFAYPPQAGGLAPNTTCRWLLTGRSGYHIQVTILSAKLGDAVLIFYDNTTHVNVAEVSGDAVNYGTIYSTGSYLFMTLITSSAVDGSFVKFNLSYIDANTAPGLPGALCYGMAVLPSGTDSGIVVSPIRGTECMWATTSVLSTGYYEFELNYNTQGVMFEVRDGLYPWSPLVEQCPGGLGCYGRTHAPSLPSTGGSSDCDLNVFNSECNSRKFTLTSGAVYIRMSVDPAFYLNPKFTPPQDYHLFAFALHYMTTPPLLPGCSGFYSQNLQNSISVEIMTQNVNDNFYQQRYQVGQQCTWRFQVYQGYVVAWSGFTDIKEGASLMIYDGEISDGVVLLNRSKGDYFDVFPDVNSIYVEGPPYERTILVSSSQVMTVVFNGPTNVNASRGRGFHANVQATAAPPPMCNGLRRVAGNLKFDGQYEFYQMYSATAGQRLPAGRVCQWLMEVAPNMRIQVLLDNGGRPGDRLTLHDGDSVSAPLLADLDGLTYNVDSSTVPAYYTSGKYALVTFNVSSEPYDLNGGVPGVAYAYFSVLRLPVPCVENQTYVDLWSQFSVPSAFAALEYSATSAGTYPDPTVTYPPGMTCVMTFIPPVGFNGVLIVDSLIATEDTVTIYDANNRIVGSSFGEDHGEYTSPCGSLTLVFQASPKSTFTGRRVGFTVDYKAKITGNSISDQCRTYWNLPSRSVCPAGTLTTNAMIAQYTNCSVITGALCLTAPRGNYTFPYLQWTMDQLFIDAATWSVSFPLLQTASMITIGTYYDPYSISFMTPLDITFNLDTLSFPQLTTAGKITGSQFPGINRLRFPMLRQVDEFFLSQLGDTVEVSLPSLRLVRLITLRNMNALSTLDFSSLESVYTLDLETLQKLKTLQMPQLTSILVLAVHTTAVTSLILHQAVMESVYLTFNSGLVAAEFPLLNSSAGQIQITQNYLLTSLNISGLLGGDIQLSNSGVTELSLPYYQSGHLNLDSNLLLTKLDIPAAVSFYASVSKSPLTTFSAPNVQQAELYFTSMGSLSKIDVCAALQTKLQVTNCPQLSCLDTLEAYNDTGLVVGQSDPAPPTYPDCNPSLKGVFSCLSNVVVEVSEACGSRVSCIQDAIDTVPSGRSYTVMLQPTVYTGCNSPLTFHGKELRLRGVSQAASIIDCEGSGQAFMATDGETVNSIVSDITFKRGGGSDGGLVYISGASPSFIDCTFSNTIVTATGAAVLVTGSDASPAITAPGFTSCTFAQNSAGTSGGALMLTGATALLVGCTFNANTATTNGGGMAVIGATTVVTLTGVTFGTNEAQRGGGLYADSGMYLDGCTFHDNRASQFGGGLAAVPVAATGVWFTLRGGEFNFNIGMISGGGIFAFSANLDVMGVRMTLNNVASGGGGAISATCSQNYRILNDYLNPCDVVVNIRDSVFSLNTATVSQGGAILARDMMLFLQDTVIESNTAQQDGGGVYACTTDLTARNVTWSGNRGANGGGLYAEPFTGTLDVTDSYFTSNVAGVTGGGVYLCTVACPNATEGAAAPTPGALPPIKTRNTFTTNVAPATPAGYGADISTDPTSITFLVAPSATVISGRSVVADGQELSAEITDGYNQVVTASTSVYTLSLSVLTTAGDAVNSAVDIGGTQTVLAVNGEATFPGVTLVAKDLSSLGAYTLACSLTEISSVSVRVPVTIAPCSPGQGRASLTSAIQCDDCGLGTAGSSDTSYVCAPCVAGYFAANTLSAACTPCPVDKHAPTAGSSSCVGCPSGFSAPNEGSADCIQGTGALAGGLSTPAVAGTVGGVIAAVLVLILILACLLYRAARRRTMAKYYLDNDATIRTGTQETPLQKEVKRIIVATSTTRIGGGLYSNVYKAKYENQWIALKVIKGDMATNGTAQQEFRREAVALSRLEDRKHPGIVQLMFFLNFNPMCIGVAFCANGSLKRAITTGILTSPSEKVRLATEAASAFAVVHACGIVHLDIKTDNMLLSADNHLIIADFGIARVLGMGDADPELPNEYVGLASDTTIRASSPAVNANVRTITRTEAFSTAFTPQYVDPIRVLHDMNHDEPYLRKADVFSFGVMMWAIYNENEPYVGINPEELVERLQNDITMRPPPLTNNPPAFYESLIHRCWHGNPIMRPTFADVFQELRNNLLLVYGVSLALGYDAPNITPVAAATPPSSRRPTAGSSAAPNTTATLLDMSRRPSAPSDLPTMVGSPGPGGGVPRAQSRLPSDAAATNAGSPRGQSRATSDASAQGGYRPQPPRPPVDAQPAFTGHAQQPHPSAAATLLDTPNFDTQADSMSSLFPTEVPSPPARSVEGPRIVAAPPQPSNPPPPQQPSTAGPSLPPRPARRPTATSSALSQV